MVSCVLWDFGDTLADERWMLEAPAQVPAWADTFVQHILKGKLGYDWGIGHIGAEDVGVRLAAILSTNADTIVDHMKRCCANVAFHENAMKAVQSCSLPQAIVTLNTDVFSECVVPNYRLHETFETIVTSWEEGTLDKSDLCDVALKRLGIADRRDALLIDNLVKNVESWRARGGLAHHFTGDDDFASNPPEVFETLF